MATAAGRRSAACRARRGTGRVSRRCAARCAPPSELGIGVLTLYSFSSENWSRPAAEVRFLLELLRRFIRTDVAELHQANVRIMMIGDRDGLEAIAPHHGGGGRGADAGEFRAEAGHRLQLRQPSGDHPRRAPSSPTRWRRAGSGPTTSTPPTSAIHLDTGGLPEPDLLIRTGGEQRLSNYLLWQCAYTEFVFMPEYWPEFDAELLSRAIADLPDA